MGPNKWFKQYKLEKIWTDIYYVKNQNFFLDIKIIILTIFYLIKKIVRGSNSKEKIIGKKFNGKISNIWPFVSKKKQ